MRFYADTAVRRRLQVTGDVVLVLWVALWIAIADKVHDATLHLAGPGYRINSSAGDLADRLRDAGRSVSKVPLVGDDVRKPFNSAGGAAEGLAGAWRRADAGVIDRLAMLELRSVGLRPPPELLARMPRTSG
jgi:hypothetical protein